MNLVSTLDGTIARAQAELGVSWPNPWWPKGSDLFNDCAAFVSWCLWGLNGTAPFHTVVSDVIEHSGLEFHAGNRGIQRGDLLGLRWSTSVNYDHIGIALGAPNSAGIVQTIDANGGTNKVAYSNRPISEVHNFARPAYPTLAPAGGGGSPLDNQEAEMPSAGFTVVQFATTHETFVMFETGRLVFCVVEKDAQGNDLRRMEQIAVVEAGQTAAYQTSDDDFNRRLWIRGRYDLDWTTVKATVADNKAHVFAVAQTAAVSGSDTATLAAIAALDKQADDYQAQLEALVKAGLSGTITIAPKV